MVVVVVAMVAMMMVMMAMVVIAIDPVVVFLFRIAPSPDTTPSYTHWIRPSLARCPQTRHRCPWRFVRSLAPSFAVSYTHLTLPTIYSV